MRNASRIVAAALAAAGLALAVAPAQAAKPKRKTVKVLDYYFSPAKMTVRRNTTVVWRWPAGGGDAHDVVLRKGPRRVKKFRSDIFVAGESYKRKLTVPGRYLIVCSLHEDVMRQTITVKR